MTSLIESFQDLFNQHLAPSVTAGVNDPYLPLFKYSALLFSLFGIGIDIYNIVMYVLFKRVYLAPNPTVALNHTV